jgi:hypothetical protein
MRICVPFYPHSRIFEFFFVFGKEKQNEKSFCSFKEIIGEA